MQNAVAQMRHNLSMPSDSGDTTHFDYNIVGVQKNGGLKRSSNHSSSSHQPPQHVENQINILIENCEPSGRKPLFPTAQELG